MKLYVGNLPWSVDDNALKELFSSHNPEEAVLIKDKYSGRSKGFGFVTVSDDAGQKAISEMNGKEIEGRALTVSEARPMVPRDSGSGYAGNSEESSETEEAAEETSQEDETEEAAEETSQEDGPETAAEAVEDSESDEPAAEEAPEEESEKPKDAE